MAKGQIVKFARILIALKARSKILIDSCVLDRRTSSRRIRSSSGPTTCQFSTQALSSSSSWSECAIDVSLRDLNLVTIVGNDDLPAKSIANVLSHRLSGVRLAVRNEDFLRWRR